MYRAYVIPTAFLSCKTSHTTNSVTIETDRNTIWTSFWTWFEYGLNLIWTTCLNLIWTPNSPSGDLFAILHPSSSPPPLSYSTLQRPWHRHCLRRRCWSANAMKCLTKRTRFGDSICATDWKRRYIGGGATRNRRDLWTWIIPPWQSAATSNVILVDKCIILLHCTTYPVRHHLHLSTTRWTASIAYLLLLPCISISRRRRLRSWELR
jgi:hypothetical protein